MSRRTELLWVACILGLALGLRLFAAVGREGGVWRVGGCDEPFVEETESIVRTGNPLHLEAFWYPPVPSFITAAGAGLWGMVGWGDLAVQCRVITLAFSVATVGVVYMVGRLWGQSHGLIAMMLYAVTMIAAVVQGNVQVYSVFFLVLALYCVLRPDAEGRISLLSFAGIWLGLGVASKYVPLFFGGMLLAPYVRNRWRAGGWGRETMAECGYGEGGKISGRAWTGGVSLVVALAAVMVWAGTVERDWVYALLRRIYEQRAHEHAFEYHLPSINRLYLASLAAVGFVGTGGAFALLVPWLRRMPPWHWARVFYARNRLWMVPCVALILTVAVTIGLPVAWNLQDFARHFVYVARASATGDNGFFPTSRPAVSYILGFIPESTGLALFIGGLIGLLYAAIARDGRAIIIVASAIPAYVLLELTRVKTNRYALELMPLWCLLTAVWLADLCRTRARVLRIVGVSLVAVIVLYSLGYSVAWAEFFSPRGDVRLAAGRWLNGAIPHGASLGVKSGLLVTGGPELLPEQGMLARYRLVDYADDPDYVLLPGNVYATMVQYLELTREGYVYNANDWLASAPSDKDLLALTRIVREDGYTLVKEFRKQSAVLGIALHSDSLAGPTWLVEHGSGAGIRIYRRTKGHEGAIGQGSR